MCVLPLTAAALRFCSVAAPVIRSPLQQIHKTSIFVGWRSTIIREQIQWDRKLDTDTTSKHLVNLRIKYSVLMPDHFSFNFINKLSLCAEPDLKSTDRRFSEVAVALDFVITVKSCLTTPAVWLCCTLNTAKKSKHAVEPFCCRYKMCPGCEMGPCACWWHHSTAILLGQTTLRLIAS